MGPGDGGIWAEAKWKSERAIEKGLRRCEWPVPVPEPVPGLNEPKRRRLVLVEMSRATASPGWRGPCSGKWTFDSRRVAMWPGRVRRVGSAVVWDPGGPEAFQEGRQFEQLVASGPDPGRPQLGDDLSVKPRASLLGPWSASLVWSSLVAWGWGPLDCHRGGMSGMGNGLTGERDAGTRARTQTQDKGHHGFRREQGAGGLTSRARSWANCGLSHKLLEPGWKAVSEGSYQLCCRRRVRGQACRLLAAR